MGHLVGAQEYTTSRCAVCSVYSIVCNRPSWSRSPQRGGEFLGRALHERRCPALRARQGIRQGIGLHDASECLRNAEYETPAQLEDTIRGLVDERDSKRPHHSLG